MIVCHRLWMALIYFLTRGCSNTRHSSPFFISYPFLLSVPLTLLLSPSCFLTLYEWHLLFLYHYVTVRPCQVPDPVSYPSVFSPCSFTFHHEHTWQILPCVLRCQFGFSKKNTFLLSVPALYDIHSTPLNWLYLTKGLWLGKASETSYISIFLPNPVDSGDQGYEISHYSRPFKPSITLLVIHSSILCT